MSSYKKKFWKKGADGTRVKDATPVEASVQLVKVFLQVSPM